MPDARISALVAVTAIVLFGTLYSVFFNTYLDTSNPLIANLPHPLHKTDYFASKANILNVYFIKQAWGWTSLVFFVTLFTSPPRTRSRESLYKWFAATAIWVVFTRWFFDRVMLYSGGECVLHLPAGELLSVPAEFCFSKSALSPDTHPTLFSTSLISDDTGWRGIPRLRRGHDVSGHIFLLTLSILFLTDQLKFSSFRGERWPAWHKWAVIANISLIVIWLFAIYTTSVYFHSPLEKVTGYRASFPPLIHHR